MWAGDHQHQRDEQQLLRRPVAVQLQERPRAARDLERRAPRDQIRHVQGRRGGGCRRQPGRRPGPPDAGCHQPGRYHPGHARDHQRLRRRPGRGAPAWWASRRTATCSLKSFYSSYGSGAVQVVAPGGDSILQLTAAAPNGRVLSTWPASLLTVTCLPARRVVDASGATYCYQQGTSMASPHAAGVAALIVSQGTKSPGAVAAKLSNTADPMACPPDLSIYALLPGSRRWSAAGLHGRDGLQLVQRPRPDQCAERCLALSLACSKATPAKIGAGKG